MSLQLQQIINQPAHPIGDVTYRQQCRAQLTANGVLVLKNFLTPQALGTIVAEGNSKQHLAFYTTSGHNAYLTPNDPNFTQDHARNYQIESSKGCIADDQIDLQSPLRQLYDAAPLRDFFAAVLDEQQLYPYADPLSSINLHYASAGQELGWHFDNSSFAITLLVQSPKGGGEFEYVAKLRNASQDDMNYAGVSAVLAGKVESKKLAVCAGDLVLFRGQDALHRVTPTQGDRTRMLVVLAYNSEPNVALSESARTTFYGRLG